MHHLSHVHLKEDLSFSYYRNKYIKSQVSPALAEGSGDDGQYLGCTAIGNALSIPNNLTL
jgi:hypothetical protein